MKRTDPQFKLRLPDELKERLEAEAARSGRSVSAEIVQRLNDSFIPLKDRVPVGWDARARIASVREIAITNIEVMENEISRSKKREKNGEKTIQLGLNAGASTLPIDDYISNLESGRRTFEHVRDASTQLLSEIAVLHANGQGMTDDEIFDYATALGIPILGMSISH